MVIKPVVSSKTKMDASEEPRPDMIELVRQCWGSCKNAWARGAQGVEQSRTWVRQAFEWFWLMFLAIVASQDDSLELRNRLPVRKKISIPVEESTASVNEAQELIVVTTNREVSVIIDQDEEKDTVDIPEESEAQSKTNEYLPGIEIHDDLKSSSILNRDIITEEIKKVDQPSIDDENETTEEFIIPVRDFKPCTIAEEEEEEESEEEREKQWRVANGGLTRFAGLQNLAMRSESFGDEVQSQEAEEGITVPDSKLQNNQEDVLWQTLVAKYTDEKNESPQPSRVLVQTMSNDEPDQSQMSEEEFSAAVGRRLSEILAAEVGEDIGYSIAQDAKSLSQAESLEEYSVEPKIELPDDDEIKPDTIEEIENNLVEFDAFENVPEIDETKLSVIAEEDLEEDDGDQSEKEITVVADFTFKLRPKEKDEISFRLKEEKIAGVETPNIKMSDQKEQFSIGKETQQETDGEVDFWGVISEETKKSPQESCLTDTNRLPLEGRGEKDFELIINEAIENNVKSDLDDEAMTFTTDDLEGPLELAVEIQEQDDMTTAVLGGKTVALTLNAANEGTIEDDVKTTEDLDTSYKTNEALTSHIESPLTSPEVQPAPITFKLHMANNQEEEQVKLEETEMSGTEGHTKKGIIATASEEPSLYIPVVKDPIVSFKLNTALEETLKVQDAQSLTVDEFAKNLPDSEKCKTKITKNLMKDPIIKEKIHSFHLYSADEVEECQEEEKITSDKQNTQCRSDFATQLNEEPLSTAIVRDKLTCFELMSAKAQELEDCEFENLVRPISSSKLQAREVEKCKTFTVQDELSNAKLMPLPDVTHPSKGKEMLKNLTSDVTNLFSDAVVDETYNIILDKEASMEADESSASIKKGILDTTVYDFDSNFDSKDIYDEKDVDSLLKPIDIQNEDNELPYEESVPEYLSEIEDLLSSRDCAHKNRGRTFRRNSGDDDELGLSNDDTQLYSAGLTAEEEAELAELVEVDKEKAEEEFENFLSLPSGLTQQELDELAELEEEKRNAQTLRDSERKELEKFLSMPVGLTDQEQNELADLLDEDLQEVEMSKATEERLAAFLAAARAESGFTGDDLEEETLDRYMNLPDRLTEEEELFLRDGAADGEVDLLKDEEYRQKIRRKYLEDLEDDEDRVLLDEYEFTEQYGSDFDYEFDDEYAADLPDDDVMEYEMEKEASGCTGILGKSSSKVEASTLKNDGPLVPPRKSKKASNVEQDREKSSCSKSSLNSAAGKSTKTIGSGTSKIKDDNKDAKDVKHKKFFRLGALGTKRKRKIPNELPTGNISHSNYKAVRKKRPQLTSINKSLDSGYNSSLGSGSLETLISSEANVSEIVKCATNVIVCDHTSDVSMTDHLTHKSNSARHVSNIPVFEITATDDKLETRFETKNCSTKAESFNLRKKTKSKKRKSVKDLVVMFSKRPTNCLGYQATSCKTDQNSTNPAVQTLNSKEKVSKDAGNFNNVVNNVKCDNVRGKYVKNYNECSNIVESVCEVLKTVENYEGFVHNCNHIEVVLENIKLGEIPLNQDIDEQDNENKFRNDEANDEALNINGYEKFHSCSPNGTKNFKNLLGELELTFFKNEVENERSNCMGKNKLSSENTQTDNEIEHERECSSFSKFENNSGLFLKSVESENKITNIIEGTGPQMAANDEVWSEEEVEVEEHQEVVTNPDGTVTVKTVKTTTKYVEVDEDEDCADEVIEEEVSADGASTQQTTDADAFGADGMGQLTEEEVQEFMMLQAERQWLDKMREGGGATEENKKSKKKKSEADKKSKKKKKKDKENKRDDILAKHVGPRVRSFDSAKMRTRFEKPKEPLQVPSNCRSCGKQVFQMEKIVAEKSAWHKTCFKCTECNKVLTLETYQSHEGSLYCKPHFKELFRPKAVVEDPTEARKERLLRRPKMIVLESNPEILPEDVVRATSKPDYGLDELSTLNVKERFTMFENAADQQEERKLEPIPVRRSQSLISRAARFLQESNGADEHGVPNSELGEFEEEEEEEDEDEEEGEDEEEEGVEEEEEGVEECVDENGETVLVKTTKKKKKTKAKRAKNLKGIFEKQSRRDEMTMMRKEELSRFRQMLCAGKNLSLKEMFESGQFENEGSKSSNKEEIRIDEKRAAKSLKEKFEKGQPFCMDEDEEGGNRRRHGGEIEEVEEVFREAETANRARNLFKQIDSKVNQDGSATILRSQSFANNGRDNRRSMDFSAGAPQSPKHAPPPSDVVRCHDPTNEEEVQVDSRDLASKFMFFATFEQRKKVEEQSKKKVFRMTPPREGIEKQGLVSEDVELGRDPNLIKCTDNYQDEVDCRNTKSILNMFKKMEAKNCLGEYDDEEEDEEGEGQYEDDSEYSDEEDEYSDEEGEEEEEEGDEEDDGDETRGKYKDELLEMLSAKKAAQLRAKFEKWEAEEARQNGINSKTSLPEGEEAMPSLDTARNLKAMFEEKAQEAAKPLVKERAKVNRFV